jgi:nickel and cobalt resistance protein CnrR
MKRIVLFFIAVVVVASLAGFGTLQWSNREHPIDHSAAHVWLHRELKLTAEQERALEPVEARFAEKQQQLSAALTEAHRALGRTMAEEKHFTPRVATAVEAVHRRIGDLQKASVEHVFEMQAVLSPEQGEKLFSLVQETLAQHRHRSH